MKKIALLSLLVCFTSCMSIAQTSKKKSNTQERVLEIQTNYGNMKIKLYNETPKHRDNFIKLASENFYDSLLFHRVIRNFMIQGGDPKSKNAGPGTMLGSGDVGYKIPAEFNAQLIHKRGALAAARDNNPEKASSGCQFYIVEGTVLTDEEISGFETRSGIKYTEEQKNIYKTIGGTPHLDQGYTVFGEIIEGMDVLDKIANAPTKPGDRPTDDIIFSIKILK